MTTKSHSKLPDLKLSLDGSEVFHAATIGVMRRLAAMKKRRPEKFGERPKNPWEMDIEAAIAEMLVAKALGQYWHAFYGSTKAAHSDVGPYQVRHTPYENGCLIVKPRDPDGVYFLVTGSYPNMTIRGWKHGEDAKHERYFRDGDKPAFFVPQNELKDTW